MSGGLLDILKLVALVSMVVDHGSWAFDGWHSVGHWLGRPAFPLFALLVAKHAVCHTRDVRRYAFRLASWGIVALLPFWMMYGVRGNVLVTLAAGVGLIGWASTGVRVFRVALGLGVLVAAFDVPSLFVFDYGLRGVLFVFACGFLVRPGRTIFSLVLCVALAAWSNLWVLSWEAAGYAAVAGLTVVMWDRCERGGFVDLRRWFPGGWWWYAFYPGHLLALVLVGVRGSG